MRDVLHTAVSRAYTSPPCGMEGIVRIFDGNEESHVVLMSITIVKVCYKHLLYIRLCLQRCTHITGQMGFGGPRHNADGGGIYTML